MQFLASERGQSSALHLGLSASHAPLLDDWPINPPISVESTKKEMVEQPSTGGAKQPRAQSVIVQAGSLQKQPTTPSTTKHELSVINSRSNEEKEHLARLYAK